MTFNLCVPVSPKTGFILSVRVCLMFFCIKKNIILIMGKFFGIVVHCYGKVGTIVATTRIAWVHESS